MFSSETLKVRLAVHWRPSERHISFAVMNDLLPRHRITVDEYYRMSEDGLLAPDVRTELIDGEVIEMPRMGSPHAGTVGKLQYILFPVVSVGGGPPVRAHPLVSRA